jgi:hypothetical protein
LNSWNVVIKSKSAPDAGHFEMESFLLIILWGGEKGISFVLHTFEVPIWTMYYDLLIASLNKP